MMFLPANGRSGVWFLPIYLAVFFLVFPASGHCQSGTWNTVTPTNLPTNRHECAFAQLGEQFYLLGGRGIKPVEAYDPSSNTWITKGFTPQEIHHFQATEYHGLLYLICAFEGNFPAETGIPFIYIYDPLTDSWFIGPEIPSARVRGSAGLVLYNEKFYVVSGLTDGHRSGWVTWFDEFDPATNTWTILPDAPHARDHFAAAVIGDKLVCAGGRRSGAGSGFFGTFDSVVRKTDVYDFISGSWTTLASPAGDLPTGRAGASTAVLNGEVIVIGGESSSQSSAHKNTQALDLNTGTWRVLSNMIQGRHGTQAIVSNGGIYLACGGGTRGGSMELNSMEVFYYDSLAAPAGTALVAGLPSASSPTIPETAPGVTYSFPVEMEHLSGNQAVLIHEAWLNGDPAFAWGSEYSYPLALAPGNITPFDLEFAPTDTGWKFAELLIVYGASLDTLIVPLQGRSAISCPVDVAPGGLSTTIGGSSVLFSWNPVPSSVKCELRGRKTGTTNFAKLRFDVPPSSISIPLATFQPGTNYEWKIRCACNLSPLEVTPFSGLANFTTPSARTADSPLEVFSVHPNPVRDRLNIQVSENAGNWTATLLDLSGRNLGHRSFSGSQANWERDDLPAGTYLLRLSGATFNTTLLVVMDGSGE